MAELIPGSVDRRRDARRNTASAFAYLGETLDRAAARAPHAGAAAVPTEAHSLVRAIEGEIIPRLLLAHRAPSGAAASEPRVDAEPTPEDRAHFLELVLHDTAAATRSFVEVLLGRGISEEILFLDVLGHTARRLGELWEEDLCDFSEVTIGLCRLHEVLREQSALHEVPLGSSIGEQPRILLSTACGDQHVFGVVMAAEFFRRARWRVWSEPGAQRGQLQALVAEISFDVLGLSASCSSHADRLGVEIHALRKASRNAKVRVLVGGRLFVESPELASRVGADAAAPDARSAPEIANRLRAEATAVLAR